MVKMQVYKVGLDPQRRPLVVLADGAEKRLLPIWIGPFEAHALSSFVQGKQFPRPLTHDLLLEAMEQLGGTLREVQVTRLEDGTFFALLVVQQGEQVLEIDARPSDALALAVRHQVDIYVAEEVLDQAQLLTETGEAEEIDRLRGLLSHLEAPENEPPEAPEQ